MKIIQRQQVKLCNWEKILKLRIKVRRGGGGTQKEKNETDLVEHFIIR